MLLLKIISIGLVFSQFLEYSMVVYGLELESSLFVAD